MSSALIAVSLTTSLTSRYVLLQLTWIINSVIFYSPALTKKCEVCTPETKVKNPGMCSYQGSSYSEKFREEQNYYWPGYKYYDQNQIITFAELRRSVERVTGPISSAYSLGHTAPKTRRNDGESLATLYPILPARESNSRLLPPIVMSATTTPAGRLIVF